MHCKYILESNVTLMSLSQTKDDSESYVIDQM